MRFEKLRRSLAKRKLQKTAVVPKIKQPADWSEVKNIGLLADGNDPMIYEKTLEYIADLKKDGKSIQALVYMELKKGQPIPVTPVGIEVITQAHFSFDYTPAKETIRDFIRTPFDLLIYLNISEQLPLEIIFRQSHALFKTGMDAPYTQGLHFAIAIDPQKETRDKLWALTENLKLYLKQIHY